MTRTILMPTCAIFPPAPRPRAGDRNSGKVCCRRGSGGLPAPQPSPEEWKAVLLEAAKDMQTAAQAQPLKVELHSTLELDGAVLAQSREDIMIREAARR